MSFFTWSIFAISIALLVIQMTIVEYPVLFSKWRFIRFFSLSSILVESWEFCVLVARCNFEWSCWIDSSVHCVRAWPKNNRRIRWNWLHHRSAGLVFVSDWNQTSATNHYCQCTANSVSGMLWKHHLHPSCVQKCWYWSKVKSKIMSVSINVAIYIYIHMTWFFDIDQ